MRWIAPGGATDYCSSFSTLWAVLLAVASTEVPACTRIWSRVKLEVSTAKSELVIWLSEEVRFSRAVCWLAILVYRVLVSKAPNRPRSAEIWSMAASMMFDAFWALPETRLLAPPDSIESR